MQMLGIESESSRRAASTLNYRILFLAPLVTFFRSDTLYLLNLGQKEDVDILLY